MNNTLLTIIDMQNGIFQKPVFKSESLIENTNQLLSAFHEKHLPVLFTQHTNKTSLRQHSTAWEITLELLTQTTDMRIIKTHSNLLQEKRFVELLADQDVQRLLVCGLVSNGCVQALCTEAVKRGIRVTLVRDAHSTFVKNADVVIDEWNAKLEAVGVQLITTKEQITQMNTIYPV